MRCLFALLKTVKVANDNIDIKVHNSIVKSKLGPSPKFGTASRIFISNSRKASTFVHIYIIRWSDLENMFDVMVQGYRVLQ